MQQLLMGNEAIALGAIAAGVNVVAGYPGTPSTEILETVAKHNPGDIYVEWSVNEKAALEVGAGAAYAGARVLVTMKQVGLNVASDPLMSLAYVGVKGGMVIVSADDPGPISSQTEQDTRHFARFSKLPVFDPASPEEAYAMIGDAFALSEKYQTPVLLRPTTRVCHGCASIETAPRPERNVPEGFVKDSKWVIFPRLSYQNHLKIESRNRALSDELSAYRFNTLSGAGKLGIAVGGVSCAYMGEALLGAQGDYKLLKVGTPHPFPDALALQFLEGLTDVLVAEELDPVIERQLIYLCGRHHLPVAIHGKLDGSLPEAGEYSVELLRRAVFPFLGQPAPEVPAAPQAALPVRPPVLCAGCPHRASFYAVKAAMKGRKAVFCGDIGCYTLGNSQPLDMVDTCLCMGADVTIAQGMYRVEPDTLHFSFIGDSTFFHTGIPGVVNAIYNRHRMVLVVLDNATTAMTGHQPHPGTGQTMMGNIVEKIDIASVLKALGVPFIRTVDPLNHAMAVETIQQAADQPGVSAVIFRSPCIALVKNSPALTVSDACVNCGRCIRELGCPALVHADGHVAIEPSLCTGCTLCAQLCPVGAIGGKQA